jgi:DNA polymerase III epsilon subunit-like protein
MKKNDLDYLEKRIGILGARMHNATPKASFYNEMAQEQSALKRICLKFEELEAEKAELVKALKTIKFKIEYCACEVCVEKMNDYVDGVTTSGSAEWKEDE